MKTSQMEKFMTVLVVVSVTLAMVGCFGLAFGLLGGCTWLTLSSVAAIIGCFIVLQIEDTI